VRKNKVFLALSIVAAITITVLFLSTQQVKTVEVSYQEVVKVKSGIAIDQKLTKGEFYLGKILEENYDPKEMYTSIDEVLEESYSNSIMVKDEIVMRSRVVTIVEQNYAEGEREILIPTDWVSSGGVQKGDKADLIFYGEVDNTYVGVLLFQDVFVKSVWNRNGEDLYNVESNKYNTADLEPMAITIIGDQEMALTIATLSRVNSTSGFAFAKYTERSKRTDADDDYITPAEIIGVTSDNDELKQLLEVIENENKQAEETKEEAKEEGE